MADSNSTSADVPGPTKPVAEHDWLRHLVGTWKTRTSMIMDPNEPPMECEGEEVVTSLGGLWAVGEGESKMGEDSMSYRNGLGYDVSFKGYRGFWVANVSSHLWKSEGTLSEDGKKMVLECDGPDMEVDGKTAKYRDTIEILGPDLRRMTSEYQRKDGTWAQSMTVDYKRVS